jgi:hypothetical protein
LRHQIRRGRPKSTSCSSLEAARWQQLPSAWPRARVPRRRTRRPHPPARTAGSNSSSQCCRPRGRRSSSEEGCLVLDGLRRSATQAPSSSRRDAELGLCCSSVAASSFSVRAWTNSPASPVGCDTEELRRRRPRGRGCAGGAASGAEEGVPATERHTGWSRRRSPHP